MFNVCACMLVCIPTACDVRLTQCHAYSSIVAAGLGCQSLICAGICFCFFVAEPVQGASMLPVKSSFSSAPPPPLPLFQVR